MGTLIQKNLSLKQVTRVSSIAYVRCASTRLDKVSIVTSMISFFGSKSALALVDDRLAGEGTGKALGINDPILGWVIFGVFATVWAVYYTATKDLGGQREEDGFG